MRNSVLRAIFVALAVAVITLTAAAQTFRPGGSNVIRDSGGHVVGQYDALGRVSVVINGYPVYLDVEPARLTTYSSYVYYDQPSCQGTAFLDSQLYGGIVSTPAAFAPDGTVRIAPSRTTSSQLVASRYVDDVGQCQAINMTIAAFATQAGPNLKSQFTAPFTTTAGTLPSAIIDLPLNQAILLAAIAASVLLVGLIVLRR